MRRNEYICDFCSASIELGYEYKIKVLYPVDDETVHRYSKSLANKQRQQETLELCEECFRKRLVELTE